MCGEAPWRRHERRAGERPAGATAARPRRVRPASPVFHVKHWTRLKAYVALLDGLEPAHQPGRRQHPGRCLAPAYPRFGAALPHLPAKRAGAGRSRQRRRASRAWSWRSSACPRSISSKATSARRPSCARRRASPAPPCTIHADARREDAAACRPMSSPLGPGAAAELLDMAEPFLRPHSICLFLKGEARRRGIDRRPRKTWKMTVRGSCRASPIPAACS